MIDYHWKKEFSYNKGTYTVTWVKIICDKCGYIITDTTENDAYERDLFSKYADLNRGHECESCRKSRRRAYDIYVTTQR